MDNVNWAKLTAQGRCKAIGVPWTEEELKAVYKLKIPVDYVRQGILTIEDYEKELSKDKKAEEKGEEKPLEKMKKDELLKKAKDLGIKIADEKVVSKGDIILEINQKGKDEKPITPANKKKLK